jgi:hypothetical protein
VSQRSLLGWRLCKLLAIFVLITFIALKHFVVFLVVVSATRATAHRATPACVVMVVLRQTFAFTHQRLEALERERKRLGLNDVENEGLRHATNIKRGFENENGGCA